MPWQNALPDSEGFNHTDTSFQTVFTATENSPVNSVRVFNGSGSAVTVTVQVVRGGNTFRWFSADAPPGGFALEQGPDSIRSGDQLQVQAAADCDTWVSYIYPS